MIFLPTFTVWAFFAIEVCSSARINTLTLEGGLPGYPKFTVNVAEDGRKVPIANPMVIYSVLSGDPYQSNCTLISTDGTVNYLWQEKIDVGPQTQVSVSCCPGLSGTCVAARSSTTFPTSSAFISSTAAIGSSTANPISTSGLTSSTTTTANSSLSSYPTTTGSPSIAVTVGTTASAVTSVTNTTVSKSTSTTVPFTGDAVRFAKSIRIPLLAFVGAIVVF